MRSNKIRILLCGCSFAGNLGGQAMYDTIIEEILKYNQELEISVLSKYPEEDRPECEKRNYRMYSFPTSKQITLGVLFFLFAGLLKTFRLPYRWCAFGCTKAYFENDILIDASGIAFSDDRSFADILINSLWFLPAFISQIPIFKVSQTLGPFNKKYVRFFSKFVLQHVDYIVCRGKRSYEYTKSFLKRDKIYNLPDSALCLAAETDEKVESINNAFGLVKGKYIAVGPSFVMRDYLEPGQYVNMIADCINRISEKTDASFVLVPHSWKHNKRIGVDSVNDDYSVCVDIKNRVDSKIRCIVIDEELTAKEFKSIIGNSYVAIGSRYHFLVAALSSGVPSMALGWSHKYFELFSEFDCEEFVLEYQNMTCDNVPQMAMELLEKREEVFNKISNKRPDVLQRSANNEKLIIECLKNKGIIE